ncbi:hypothetical protein TUM20983_01070 [Mycobacterium antarcticum]|uniref:DUF3060 domain-containing protein n=1 Tax=Mycolicibacterium sp. TUM20983 TaxID=3023369 RepID=UPI0023874742|nr:DUF3060 domain-containing protein [Mycolicibacterium sp. TUM20983]GLP72997.1 hypothetical protein TUM20983_01070 [Mycolicibacterium sp. TUM20983]
MTSPEDPEQRIAELEKQVADARRIADLEAQLAEARSRQMPMAGADQMSDVFAALRRLRPGMGRTTAGPPDTRLVDPPRRIPVRIMLAELLPFRWWYVFAMFMVAIPPIIVWITNPELLAPAAVAVLVAIYGIQSWTARTRLVLLRWGRVAQVTGAEVISRGTYYSGTTYSNVWLPQAHGWTVTRQLWSGPSTKTKVTYEADGRQGALVVKGRSYDGGVILADARHPERALCVSSFAYDLDRDESGNWTGRLRTRLMIGMAVWVLIVIGWLGVAIGISSGAVGRLMAEHAAIRLEPGGARTVTDSGHQTVYCNDGHLTVGGGSGPVTVHGHCVSLAVSGIDSMVTVDSVDVIMLDGIGNHVTYHSGTPRVTLGGISNTAVPG